MLSRPQLPFDHAYRGIDLPSGSALVAAVSGGSDSLALLVSINDHLARFRPDLKLIAVTIDHGLRASSAAEAQGVADLCASLGIRHVTLRWHGDKPKTGIAAAARTARYRLLCEAAGEFGAAAIVTGHTADDQAETIAMRMQRGKGRGLAAMASATLFGGRFWLLRPLLGIRRTALRDYLRERRIVWIDDPTNDDTSYERPRIRRDLTANSGIGDLLVLGQVAAQSRELLGVDAAALIREFVSRPAPGLFEISPAMLQQPNREAATYALRILLAVAGGVPQLPDENRTRALVEALANVAHSLRMTLSRSVIDGRRNAIFLYRENRGLPDWAQLEQPCHWDGRYRIEPASQTHGPLVGPFGRGWAEPAPAGGIPLSVLRAARAAEPAVMTATGAPQLPNAFDAGVKIEPVSAPWATLLPSFDLAPARAIAALAGAAIAPDPPYRGHSEGQA